MGVGAAAWGLPDSSLLEQNNRFRSSGEVMRTSAFWAAMPKVVSPFHDWGKTEKGTSYLSTALIQCLALAMGNWGQEEKH